MGAVRSAEKNCTFPSAWPGGRLPACSSSSLLNYVGVATRRLLASGALGSICGRGIGVAAVSFVTVYRLAELLGSAQLAGSGRRPVSTPVIAAALRSALTREPGIFAPVAGHAATETALVEAYRELRDLSDGALDALARSSAGRRRRPPAQSGPGQPGGGVLRRGGPARRPPPRRCVGMEAAAAVLGTVIVYLPERLSRHGGALLGAVAEASERHRPGGDHRGRPGRRRGRAVGTPHRREWGRDAPRRRPAHGRREHGSHPDPDRLGLRRGGAGGRALHRRCGPGAGRHSTAWPSSTPVRCPMPGWPTSSWLPPASRSTEPRSCPSPPAWWAAPCSGLFALPESGFRREDVFAWLAGGRLRQEGRPLPVTAWERLSREAGVVAGRNDWDHRLATFAADARGRGRAGRKRSRRARVAGREGPHHGGTGPGTA